MRSIILKAARSREDTHRLRMRIKIAYRALLYYIHHSKPGGLRERFTEALRYNKFTLLALLFLNKTFVRAETLPASKSVSLKAVEAS